MYRTTKHITVPTRVPYDKAWYHSSYTCTVWQSMVSQMILHLKIKQILLAQWINSCYNYSTNTDGLKHGYCIDRSWFDSRLLDAIHCHLFCRNILSLWTTKPMVARMTKHCTIPECWSGAVLMWVYHRPCILDYRHKSNTELYQNAVLVRY